MKFSEAIRHASLHVVKTPRGTHAIEMAFPVREMSREEFNHGMDCLSRMGDLHLQGVLDPEAGRCRLLLKETPHESLLHQHLANSRIFRQRLIRALDMGLEIENENRWQHVREVVQSPNRHHVHFGRSAVQAWGETLRTMVASRWSHALFASAAGAMLMAATATHAIKQDWLGRAMGNPLQSEYVRHVTMMHMDRIRSAMDHLDAHQHGAQVINETLRHMTDEANYAVNRAIRGVELLNAESYGPLKGLVMNMTRADIEAMHEARSWIERKTHHEQAEPALQGASTKHSRLSMMAP